MKILGARGQKSVAELSLAAENPNIEVLQFDDAKPPDDLRDEEVQIWRGIVESMDDDWLTVETHPLLAQYCRHTVRARRLAALIGALEQPEDEDAELDLKEYTDLLKAEEVQSRALASLATKLRISQQSTYDRKKILPKGKKKKPWELTGKT